MNTEILTPQALASALAIRDLTNPAEGPHAMQQLLLEVTEALEEGADTEVRLRHAHPVVTVAENYDRLHYPADGVARDARYTRYVSEGKLLRTQTSAMIPALLEELAKEEARDVLLVCPGLVYRRDQIDRLHSGEPHQVDLWRVAPHPLRARDLLEMVRQVVGAALPGAEYRLNEVEHPYTTGGLEIEVRSGEEWVEVGECGLALPAILREAGLDSRWTGLAMGLGLDRLLMLRKGVEDIRLLRSREPRVAVQMLSLECYQPVSSQPAIRRDLSLAVGAGVTAEELGDRVRQALGSLTESLEAVEVLAETPGEELPEVARARIGLGAGQKNVLLRVVIRDLVRTLTSEEANEIRDQVYAAVHEGSVWQWVTASRQLAAS